MQDVATVVEESLNLSEQEEERANVVRFTELAERAETLMRHVIDKFITDLLSVRRILLPKS